MKPLTAEAFRKQLARLRHSMPVGGVADCE